MRDWIKVISESQKEKLEMPKLKYELDSLEPVLSKQNLHHHYNKLTKGYIDKFNETGDDFQKAGALLHTLWWNNLKSPSSPNLPIGNSKEFIIKHFNSFDKFKEEFKKAANNLRGSGWVALLNNGRIEKLSNHIHGNSIDSEFNSIISNIILLIDLWEHAYYLDFPSDRNNYMEKIWHIIDWNVVSNRINEKDNNE